MASCSRDKKRKMSRISIEGLDWFLISLLSPSKRMIRKASSSTSTSQDLRFIDMLKHVSEVSKEQLGGVDDAFRLSWREVLEIGCMFRSDQWPTPKEFFTWDPYTRAFYLKLLTCCENKPPLFYKSLKRQEGTLSEDVVPSKALLAREGTDSVPRRRLKKPFKFGRYSPGTEPDRIPYHLYLLVKKAVDIIKSDEQCISNNQEQDLRRVEEKIRFFSNYFHSHLPTGWKYKREDASNAIAGYDPTRKPKYDMSGYTPISCFRGRYVGLEWDPETNLARNDMLAVMCIIHSRETPVIWKMGANSTLFYVKICSCFGIDYHCLEAASEDDVCLMNVGLQYP